VSLESPPVAVAVVSLPSSSQPTSCSIGGDGFIATSFGRDVQSYFNPLQNTTTRLADLVYSIASAPIGISFAHLLLASTRVGPLTLIDADKGSIINTLAAKNVNEELVHLFTSTWSCARYAHAWAGGDNSIYEFDVSSGRAVSVINTAATTSKSKGRIAALASAPDASGLIACGSLDSKTVNVYDERSSSSSRRAAVCSFNLEEGGGGGGVTNIRFSPDGRFLYTGYRRQGALIAWDLRESQRVLYRFPRDDSVGQRLGFDVSNHTLATASRDGSVLLYRVDNGELDVIMNDWISPPVDVGFFDGGGAFAVLSGPRHGETSSSSSSSSLLSVWTL
jgi:WD40 repeat protein